MSRPLSLSLDVHALNAGDQFWAVFRQRVMRASLRKFLNVVSD